MSLVFDEYGRPFIILKEQDQKTRLKGIAALKVDSAPHSARVPVQRAFPRYVYTALRFQPSSLPPGPCAAYVSTYVQAVLSVGRFSQRVRVWICGRPCSRMLFVKCCRDACTNTHASVAARHDEDTPLGYWREL